MFLNTRCILIKCIYGFCSNTIPTAYGFKKKTKNLKMFNVKKILKPQAARSQFYFLFKYEIFI